MIFLTIVIILVITLYFYIKQKLLYFDKRGIPYIKPSTFLGNTWRSVIFQENISESIDRLYKENIDKGIYGIFHGFMPVVLVSDPDLIKEVTVKEFSHFHNRGFTVNEDLNPLDNNLLGLSGVKWKTLRNKLSPTFTSGKLKGMLPLMDECCNTFMETIKFNQDVNMTDLFGKLTLHVIGSCTFGITSDAMNSNDSLFIHYCKKIARPDAGLFIRTMINFSSPKLARALGVSTWPADMYRFFNDLVKQGFEMRKSKKVIRNDFLQILLELKEKGEIEKDDTFEDDVSLTEEQDDHSVNYNKIILDDTLLTAQAFVFLAAGHETTATSLAFTCYLLSKNKQVQDKARQEVMEVKQKYRKLNYEALKDLVYLEACIKETLRLHPPVGTLGRKCNKQTNIGGVDIEKGIFVFLPVSSIQKDPNYFARPEEFRPERFLEEDCHEYAYLPFGSGPRICIGLRFAMLEMKLTMAKFLETYSLDPSPKMASLEPIKLRPMSFVNVPKHGIYIIIRKL